MRVENLVTDTHPLLHYLCGNQKKLSVEVRLAFDNAFGRKGTTIYVPSIVLIEVTMLVQKQKINLKMSFETWVDALFGCPLIMPLSFDHEAAKINHGLTLLCDPFDRAIVASALRMDLPLITNDSLLHRLEPCQLYW
jgi:PIN domain nuclease of toxin-antitoxin system